MIERKEIRVDDRQVTQRTLVCQSLSPSRELLINIFMFELLKWPTTFSDK